MAYREGPIGGSVPDTKIVIGDAADGTSSNATPENAIASAGSDVHQVKIDCTLNPGEDVYTRFYDSAAPTVGTDDAVLVLKGLKGQVVTYDLYNITHGASPVISGIDFATQISVATVTNRGGTGGADNPTGIVIVTILLKQ